MDHLQPPAQGVAGLTRGRAAGQPSPAQALRVEVSLAKTMMLSS